MPDNQSKREIANQELNQTLGTGVVSIAPPPIPNFNELQKTENGGSGVGTVNNFNTTNVTVNSAGKALPTTSSTPDQIKKNSYQPLPNLTDDKSPNHFERMKKTYIDQSPIPMLTLAGLGNFKNPDVAEYTFSESSMKQSNGKFAKQLEILHNITKQSFSDQNIEISTPYSYHDNSTMVNKTMNQRQEYNIENLTIANNVNNNMEIVNELARQRERSEQRRTENIERAVDQAAQTQVPKEIADADDIEASTMAIKDGAGSSPLANRSMKPRKISNLNPTNSTIGLFIDKMNSPPSWRTVLG